MRTRKIASSLLVMAAGLAAFFAAYSYYGESVDGVVHMSSSEGVRPYPFERRLAAHARDVFERAHDLRKPLSDARMRTHPLAQVGNADWLAACDLVDAIAADLAPLVQDGQPGLRLRPRVVRLLAHLEPLRAVVARFAAASMLREGALGAEMDAFLRDARDLLVTLQRGLH